MRAGFFILVIGVCALPTHAAIVYQSAESGPTGQTSGSGVMVDNEFFAAVNFEVTQTVVTGRVGAHLFSFVDDGPVFAALVRLDGPLDVPDEPNLSGDDVLGATLIQTVWPSDNVSGNLRLTLEPGWYAMVIGTDRFGASGTADLVGNNVLVGTPRIYSIRQSDGAIILQASPIRFFVDTIPLPLFEKIVDTDTTIPGSEETFDRFSPAAIRDGAVVFRARGPDGSGEHEDGIYRVDGDGLRTIANLATDIPGSDAAIESFDTFASISEGSVVFSGGSQYHEGIYAFDGEAISVVADSTMETPDGAGLFTTFSPWSTIHKNDVAFMGRGDTGSMAVYARIGGSLVTIANETTQAPDGLGPLNLVLFGFVSMEHGRVSFRTARVEPLLLGLFRGEGQTIDTVVDSTMTMPGGTDLFGAIGLGPQREGKIAFGGADDLADPTDLAIFSDASGSLERVVDLSTPIPEGDGTFASLYDPSFDGRHVAFLGYGEGGVATRGIYTNVTGELTKVAAIGDVVDGKSVTSVGILFEEIDIYRIVLNLIFDDDSRGIYVAHYPPVPGDSNGDGFVDLRDVSTFQNCFGDRDQPGCASSDFSGDFRVNLRDYQAFSCLGGPGAVPPCGQ